MEIIFGYRQGSILGSLLVNIFLADLFSIIIDIDIASYSDDNTPYIIADNIDDLIKSLEEASTALFQWLDNNLFKSNPGKRHLLISGNENIIVHVDEYEIENSKCQKLLGVKLDWKLNFDDRIFNVCKNTSGKLDALARIAPFIGLSKRRIIMKAFLNSQFSYCPLILICHSRINNWK